MRRYRFCTAPLDKAAQVRELEEFFRGQNPIDLAAADWHTRMEQGLTAEEEAEFTEWLAASTAHEAALRHLGQSLAAARSIPPNRWRACARSRHAGARSRRSRTPGTGPAAPVLRRAPRLELVLPAAAPCPGGPVLHGGLGLGRGRGLAPVAAAAHLHQQPPDPTRPGQDHHLAGWHRTVPGCRYPGAGNSVPRPARGAHHARADPVCRGARQRQALSCAGRPARVTVGGTRFSVRYRATGMEAGSAQVAVQEGHVRVAGAQGAATPADLVAGQALSVACRRARSGGGCGARQHCAVAQGTDPLREHALADALAELERYGPTGLVVHDPAVAALRIGGTYQTSRPAEFARMLVQILPVTLVAGPDGQTEIAAAP
ncbi:Protein AF-17 [Manis javanica]|nr:Protein AF-17 [Manis javanica]